MSHNRQRLLSLGLVFLLTAVLYHLTLSNQNSAPLSKTAFKLNTVITVTIYDSDNETLLDETLALCDRYENLFSPTRSASEIYQLNHGTLPQENGAYLLSPETAELIRQGLSYCRLSDGGFDLTIEPVTSLWDFPAQKKEIPSPEALSSALSLVDYRNLALDGNRLTLRKEGVRIDPGAIAKGYIADRMKEYLVSKGVKSALINLGGNVLCIGSMPDQKPFRIGIQKPFADRSETVASLEITDKSVVSSGIYERCFEKDGTLYHHLLNPKTGFPYDNSLVSVTIISDRSVDGDGLSTSCFALGLEQGMALVNRLPEVHAVFLTKDQKLHYSEDFPYSFR